VSDDLKKGGPAATPVGTFCVKDAGSGQTLIAGLKDWVEATERLAVCRRERPGRALKIVKLRG
jgi:hypothetical protein